MQPKQKVRKSKRSLEEQIKQLKNLNNHSMMYKLGSTATCFADVLLLQSHPCQRPPTPVQIPVTVTGDARVSEVVGDTSEKESTSSTFACALPAQPIANAERVEILKGEFSEFSGTFVDEKSPELRIFRAFLEKK